MSIDFENLIRGVEQWCAAHGISLKEDVLPAEKAGEFTGRSVVMNGDFEPQDRLFYLSHAIGSIVLWSRNKAAVQQMFDELRDAKKNSHSEPHRLDRAIGRYRSFEIQSSELAVSLLDQCGGSDVIGAYTNFMRADLDAMTQFHRTGRAPVWRGFFRKWNGDVLAGRRQVEPFQAKPIPAFQPIEIEKQEILQR
jgi:hypothetical protein